MAFVISFCCFNFLSAVGTGEQYSSKHPRADRLNANYPIVSERQEKEGEEEAGKSINTIQLKETPEASSNVIPLCLFPGG